MKVRFNYADRKVNFKPKSTLKLLVQNIFTSEKIEADSVDYIFCSDEYLLEINRSALNHDYYTDIITFPLNDIGKPVQAEIYISIDRVKDNALTHNTTFSQEFARVIAHGALHLCGYKDKTKAEISLIRGKETFYISRM